ncbi:MAG: hypothetical protein IJ774_02740 [Selenomonadaceae bacterium]|nr:hypothetical protein [Selenomonadaceae bacterium]
MKIKTQTVRQKMLARDLKGVIDLPDYDDNQRVEVTVTPVEQRGRKILSDEEINAIWDRIAGCLAGVDKSKTLDDWRTERLEERYGIAY